MSENSLKLEKSLSKCCVPNCNNKNQSSKLIQFPKDQKVSAIWAANCKLENQDIRNKLICPAHFERRFLGAKLKKDALPTVFDWEVQFKELPSIILNYTPSLKKCSISDCFGTNRTHRLFPIPTTLKLREKWYENCGFKKDFNSKSKFICIRHFKSDDLDENKLKNGSVPALNLNNPALIVCESAEKRCSVTETNKNNEDNDAKYDSDCQSEQIVVPKRNRTNPMYRDIKTYAKRKKVDDTNVAVSSKGSDESSKSIPMVVIAEVKNDFVDIESIPASPSNISENEENSYHAINPLIEPTISNSDSVFLSDNENDDIAIEDDPIAATPDIIPQNGTNLCTSDNLLIEETVLNSDNVMLSDTENDNIDLISIASTPKSASENEEKDSCMEINFLVPNANSAIFSDVQNIGISSTQNAVDNSPQNSPTPSTWPILNEPANLNSNSPLFSNAQNVGINSTQNSTNNSLQNLTTPPTWPALNESLDLNSNCTIFSNIQNISTTNTQNAVNNTFQTLPPPDIWPVLNEPIVPNLPNLNPTIFPNVENITINCQQDLMTNSFQDLSDPGTWPELNDDTINKIISTGPKQVVNYNFPTTNNNGKFDTSYYNRTLANGSNVPRPWLVYSISKDAVYCFCCLIFRNNRKKSEEPLSKTGLKNWRHFLQFIKSHENNKTHIENFKSWKILENCVKKKRNKECTENTSKTEILYWNNVLLRLLALVKFLGVQSLSFQGTSENLYNVNNGNFLKLLETVAKFDRILGDHLKKIVNEEMQKEYIGRSLQNQLIHLIADSVKQKISSMVKVAKYYSIIIDLVPDKNYVEQISLIIRFLHQENNTFSVKEHFLGFLEQKEKLGDKLHNLILQELSNLKLSISDCRGQSYDYESNMLVKKFSTQEKIRLVEPRIFFVPSASHSINLLVINSARNSLDAVEFFDNIQDLYTFLTSSTNRWATYKQKFPNLVLENFSEIKWASEINAIKPLKHDLRSIHEVLLEISEREKSADVTITAESLANKILNIKFICSLLVWYDIIEKINMVNIYFQGQNISLSYGILLLETTIQFLTSLKQDKMFDTYFSEAENHAKSFRILHIFPNPPLLGFRKIDMSAVTPQNVNALANPKLRFKTDFYLKILDETISSLKERCELLKAHTKLFSFLYDINGLQKAPASKNLMKFCWDLEHALTLHGKHSDFDYLELSEELKHLSPITKLNQSSIEVLNYIFQSNLEYAFPNCVVALKILNTLPITVAPGEIRSKLIRTYLRTKTTQDLLIDLPVLSIEKELVEMLDYDCLAADFANLKAKSIPVYVN